MQTVTLSEFCRIVKKVSDRRAKRSWALGIWAKTMERVKKLESSTEESLGIEEAVCMNVLIDMIYLTSGICDGYFLFKIRQYFLCTFEYFFIPICAEFDGSIHSKKINAFRFVGCTFWGVFPVPEALEHPHARQAVISIIDKIFFITKSPQTIIGEKISTVLVLIDMAGKYW